jgi:LacI family transcriptional regulator
MTNIHDVAKRAGVSPVTVSRVINGASNVHGATRERVEQAIQELGYVPNLSARSLRSRQTSTLALIVPDITNAFWTTVARGVEDTAEAEGYSVLLCNTDESLAKQTGYLNAVLQQRVDGVIIAPYDSDPRNLSQLGNLKTPLVVLDRRVDGWDVDTVRTDSISGAYALTQHLTRLGYRQIAIISGPSVTSTAEERVAGYCLALEEAGIAIDPRLIRRGEYRSSSGRVLTDQLLNEGISLSAIVAANNIIALGVLESLQNHGKTVPQDIALVCFDELPDLARFYPFLTVVVQPAYDMGINAAQLLLSRINANAPLHPRQVVLPSRLVLRYSCGRFLKQADAGAGYLTPLKDQSETILIRPLVNVDSQRLVNYLPGYLSWAAGDARQFVELDEADASSLAKVLLHRKADRLPHVEARIANKTLLEFVLQRSLPYDPQELASGKQAIAPLDYVEFARRVGLDAIPCDINWLPGFIGPATAQEAPERMVQAFPPPALTEIFNRLEGYLRAAQGTRIGVYLSFSGPFGPALHAAGIQAFAEAASARLPVLERLMDVLMRQQEKVIRAVCDRFAADVAFTVIRDDLFGWTEMTTQSSLFQEVILPRLFRLIAPIREQSLLVGLNSTGRVEEALPVLYKQGFNLIQSMDPQCNDLRANCAAWQGRIAFVGGFPLEGLISGSREAVERRLAEFCQEMAMGGGFVMGAAGDISADVRPELFLALARAVHRCRSS